MSLRQLAVELGVLIVATAAIAAVFTVVWSETSALDPSPGLIGGLSLAGALLARGLQRALRVQSVLR
jgi:hypothetical protein